MSSDGIIDTVNLEKQAFDTRTYIERLLFPSAGVCIVYAFFNRIGDRDLGIKRRNARRQEAMI